MFIGGRWCQPNSRLPVISPATGQQIATIPAGNAGDIDRAVKAAQKAFYERTVGALDREVQGRLHAKDRREGRRFLLVVVFWLSSGACESLIF